MNGQHRNCSFQRTIGEMAGRFSASHIVADRGLGQAKRPSRLDLSIDRLHINAKWSAIPVLISSSGCVPGAWIPLGTMTEQNSLR